MRRACWYSEGMSGANRRRGRSWPGGVHFVRSAQGDLLRAVEPRIDRFHALGEAVVLVRHFVLPRAEPAAAVDIARGQLRLNAAEAAVTMQRGNRIAVFQTCVPRVMHGGIGIDERRRHEPANDLVDAGAAID